ncbi:collagen alpha-6(VI) chain-like isoform X2 [Hemitrygon akajei]|uniref:collagen alpha-6(VI) chain-like isoform X2 n=1 Tax=Hemitrygon akajei TaxID=2704970 RepID=UPI003BF95049
MGLLETSISLFLLTTTCITNSQAQVLHEPAADIVFLIDGSQNMGIQGFRQIRTFLLKTISKLNVKMDAYRIGLAQYSDVQRAEFVLNKFQSKKEVLNYIKKRFQYKGGASVHTGIALDFLLKRFFTQTAGSRKDDNIPQIAIIITSAPSEDNVENYAASLKKSNVISISIGVKKADIAELQKIAYRDSLPFVYKSDNVGDISDLSSDVLETVKNIHNIIKRQAIVPASDCSIDIVVGFDLAGWSGLQNIFTGQQKLRQKLPEIMQKITSVSNISCIPDSQLAINVAFYLQSTTGQVIFETKFENYTSEKTDLLKATQAEGKIDMTIENLESFGKKLSEANSKAKAIIIFTDGLDGSKDAFAKVTRSLREKGINALITVALEGAQNVRDLSSIEYGRGFGYKKALSIEMEDIANALHTQINTIVEKECCCVLCKCTGEPGARGPRGKKGAQGNKGAQGFPGYFGEDGEPGERGRTGPNGTHGIEGCPGTRGSKGMAGYPGQKGIGGIDGIDGIAGEQGDGGVVGPPGEKGMTGNLGSKGQKGETGEIGKMGLRGDHGEFGKSNNIQGPKGVKGDTGFAGDTGGDGVPGKRGRAGRPGVPGHRGPSGQDGKIGKPGKRGPTGSQGFQGSQGVSGPSGPQGRNGEKGPRGQQGVRGVQGEQGIEGIQGFKGQNGESGNPGEKGVSGPPGRRGSMGLDGDDGFGSQGSKGRKGEIGPQGNIGKKGERGEAGINGEQGFKGMKGNQGYAGDPGDLGESGVTGNPGPKGLKGPTGAAISPCDLIKTVRATCPCCSARSGACPAYPTELAFALDASSDVTPPVFERMKKIVINLLNDINIAENNCPTGARVAVLTYHIEAKPYIRFSDFRKKQPLLKKIEELGHERSSKKRNMGKSMQSVVRNTFKRVRNGVLVKKIAVFLTNGASKDTRSIATAAKQFSTANIMPVILSFKDIPEVKQTFQVDPEDSGGVVVLPKQQQESKKLLSRVAQCILCLDKCEPKALCLGTVQPSLIPVNLDLAFVVENSEGMQPMHSEAVQHFLSSMVNTFLSSEEPKVSELHPRVAIVQNSPNYTLRYGKDPHELEFAILDYNSRTLKKRHIQDSVSPPEDSTGISSTIDWSLKNFFSNFTKQQTHKVIFTIVSGERNMDDKKLLEVAHEAKCKGLAVFALVLGEVANATFLEEFVSFPSEQHLVYLDKALDTEIEYAQKFAVAFLKTLATGINSYPPSDLVMECKGIKAQETVKEAEEEPPINLQLLVVMNDSENPQSYNNISDMCALKQETGLCQNYTIKWFFDNERGCERFWYGGCGGNANRFDTKKECENSCLKNSLL